MKKIKPSMIIGAVLIFSGILTSNTIIPAFVPIIITALGIIVLLYGRFSKYGN